MTTHTPTFLPFVSSNIVEKHNWSDCPANKNHRNNSNEAFGQLIHFCKSVTSQMQQIKFYAVFHWHKLWKIYARIYFLTLTFLLLFWALEKKICWMLIKFKEHLSTGTVTIVTVYNETYLLVAFKGKRKSRTRVDVVFCFMFCP